MPETALGVLFEETTVVLAAHNVDDSSIDFHLLLLGLSRIVFNCKAIHNVLEDAVAGILCSFNRADADKHVVRTRLDIGEIELRWDGGLG